MKITNVMAVSVDGRIASHPGEKDKERRELGFTNDDDRAHIEALVKSCDAVIVGSSSIKASGGAFEVLNDKGTYPHWYVLTRAGLPPDSRFLRQDKLPRTLVSERPLPHLKATPTLRNVVATKASVAQTIVAELRKANLTRVILFGGSEVNRIFYQEKLVDEVILTLCPLIIARSEAVPLVAPELESPVKLTLTSSQPRGNLVFLTYTVQKQ
nr:RibD C-terminal domain protein [uncultured bacterium]